MIGWPVIGLLGGLPQAAHDGVPEVFSTEKRRASFALAAGPAVRATRPEPPWLDALNMKPYLSPTLAALRLTAAVCEMVFCATNDNPEPILPMPAPLLCADAVGQLERLPPAGPAIAYGGRWPALALLCGPLHSQPSLDGLPQPEMPWAGTAGNP